MTLLLAMATIALDPSATIWTPHPATRFYESSVLGNGRLGAMVFGDPSHERVVLNESGMWSGSPQDADREDAAKALPEIRRLLLSSEHAAAQELIQKNFVCKGPGSSGAQYGCYQVFCDLLISSAPAEATNYRRWLDLDSATAYVEYDLSDLSTHFTREAFASAPAQVVAYRYKASKKGQITFDARLQRSERATFQADGQDFVIKGELDSGNPAIPGVRYEGRLRVVAKGGKVTTDAAGIHVRDADEATLLFAANTTLNAPHFDTKARIEAAAKRTFDALKKESVRDHQRYYRRVALDLPKGPSASKPTLDRLIAIAEGEEDPSLAALYFNFGRYLLISSSRPDSPWPANLQGIWAEELRTPWNGDFHLDINVQMNYWPAETTNLSDCQQPLLRFIQKLVPNGRKTARAYYDADGWVAHVITNPWLFTSPGEGSSWGSNVAGGAWLCHHLWAHYAYTRDLAYLKTVYPTLKGAAEFFLNTLIEEPKHGWLVTAPSNSPENSFKDPKTGQDISNCMGPTVDQQIVRELFGNVIEASQLLGIDQEFREKVSKAKAKLAPTQVGKHGQIMEWLEDYEESDVHHRHLSPLYAIYPGDQITPELAQAARVTLDRRGDESVGWASAWKAGLWARLHDGERAWKLLKLLLHPVTDTNIRYDKGGGAYPNLLDASPPFQIDGNFGGTAAVAEMLLQSRPGEVELLPALPKAWSEGSVKGLKAQGGLTVDIRWKDGKVVDYKITGPNAKKVRVKNAPSTP